MTGYSQNPNQRLMQSTKGRIPMSILNVSIKHTRFLLLYLLGVAALVTSQMVFAAEITRERGTGGQPEAIRIKGALNLGDEEKFRALALTSKKAIVYLDSPGGYVQPAIEIGMTIRLKGFETAVENAQCVSACALIWLAGEPRMMSNFSSIGFHAPYVNGKDGKRTSGASQGALICSYLTRLGFSEKVVMFVVKAGSEEMQWLQKSTADILGISVNLSTASQRRKAHELFSAGLKLKTVAKPSLEEVAKLYRASADLGFAGAQNNLGDLYESGEGVPQNQKVAIYWYTRAAERGEPTAYFSLASLLSEGSNDTEILAESMKFATLAFMFLQPEIDSITGWDVASFIFWALIIYFAAFISFHLVKNLISLLIRFSSEKIKDESTKAESGQSGTNQAAYSDGTDRAAYAERMSDYLREAQSYLDKQKEAKFGGK